MPTPLPPMADALAFAPQAVPAELAAPLLPADQPLALLPVRLETRFFAQADGAQELRIRVFPDQIHVDAHEPALSAGEVEWGQHFWKQTWAAGADETRLRAAWQQLADRFDPARAAWIARALTPTHARGPDPAQPGTPQFPAVTPRPDNVGDRWNQAPLAQLLPQRWFALARAHGQVVGHAQSLPLVRAPALGPGGATAAAAPALPNDDKDDGDDGDLAIDAGMRWMVDFATAEQDGLALRMTLPAAVAEAGIDTLLVFGVDAGAGGEQGSAAFAGLLDAHHYTDGLAFVASGTPTNNTIEEPSGRDSADPGQARSYDAEWRDALATLAPNSQAERMAWALGLGDAAGLASLGRIEGAQAREQHDARQMATALWPATWGYYLANLIGSHGTGLTPAAIDWARAHFIDAVRPFGPLPALRVGRQPYGVLPVSLLADVRPPKSEPAAPEAAPAAEPAVEPAAEPPVEPAAEPAADPAPATAAEPEAARERWLRDLLVSLRDRLWRVRIDAVPRVGRAGSRSADAELAAAMQTDGIAAGYQLRHLFGPRYLQHLRSFLGVDPAASGWWATHDALSYPVLQQLGFGWRPRVAAAAFAPHAQALDGPLVTDAEPAFIQALLDAPPLPSAADASAADPAAPPPPTDARSLLQVLLRQALQREFVAAAARIAARDTPGAASATPPVDAELMNFNAATRVTTWRELLAQKTAATGMQTIAEFLRSSAGLASAEAAPLRELRDALAHLRTLDAASLQRLLAGTLDLCSHRLDAWITSLATRRLEAMRRKNATGLHVGAYGWLLNLRPAAAAEPLPTPAGETGPVFALPGDPGFLHAPSLDQAQTAALLRNGHLGKANVQAEGAFAIDLSSRRVRIAEQLLDGVRQGQPLGALLGYRFERSLHARRLDAYVDACRRIAPLVNTDAADPNETDSSATDPNAPTLSLADPSVTVAANRVVDGLLLHAKWQDFVRNQATSLPPPDSPFLTCAAALRELADAIDALGDAVVAETAYQAVRGNTVRTASTLAAIAHGEAPPPELEVARTPRSGIALTHRVLWLLAAPPATPEPAGWTPPAKSPRAAAEPRLNAWAASLLPLPSAVRFTVERLAGDGRVLISLELRLADLALAPLDLICMAPAQPGAATPEIDELAIHVARGKLKKLPAGARLRVDARRRAGWAGDEFSLREVLEIAARARQCLSGARAADPRDLAAPAAGTNGDVDAAELEKRAAAAEKALAAAATKLTGLLATPDTASLSALRASNLAMQRFGFTGAVPAAPLAQAAAERAALLAQARALVDEAARRRATLATQRAAPKATTAQRAAAAAERLRTVFGAGFLALAPFTAANGAELAASIAASWSLQGGDPLAVAAWLQRLARVRDGVGRFSATLHAAEMIAAGASAVSRPHPLVAQLPHVDGERWVGLPLKAGGEVPAGKLSLVLQAAAELDSAQALVGLWLDDWVEVVPQARENTGIAFRFNAPDAAAPQAILLAVPADASADWTAWSLHRLLLETLELAALRAVDAEAFDRAFVDPVDAGGGGGGGVGEVAHFLPALCFAVNAAGDAVAPDFTPLH